MDIITGTKTTLESQMAAIVRRMNDIGENPLCRSEIARLRKAYTRAVVEYFDGRRDPLSWIECGGVMASISAKTSTLKFD